MEYVNGILSILEKINLLFDGIIKKPMIIKDEEWDILNRK